MSNANPAEAAQHISFEISSEQPDSPPSDKDIQYFRALLEKDSDKKEKRNNLPSNENSTMQVAASPGLSPTAIHHFFGNSGISTIPSPINGILNQLGQCIRASLAPANLQISLSDSHVLRVLVVSEGILHGMEMLVTTDSKKEERRKFRMTIRANGIDQATALKAIQNKLETALADYTLEIKIEECPHGSN